MRPKDWENPWNDPKNIVKFDKNFMSMRTKDGTSPEDVMRQDRRDIYEAGADAMLEALFKMAEESPTGTFHVSSRVINIFTNE